MVMNVSNDVYKIDAYPDADFARKYGHENHTDPACAKSCTGFIITFADCPVIGNRNYKQRQLYRGWKPKF